MKLTPNDGIDTNNVWIPISNLSNASTAYDRTVNSSRSLLINSFSALLVAGMISFQKNMGSNFHSTMDPSSVSQGQAFRIPSAMYDSLSRTVKSFGAATDGESHHLDDVSIVEGQKFIELLRIFDVAVPQVFAHGGDSLVFTWDMLQSRRYVTTSEGMAILQEIDMESANVRLEKFFDLGVESERNELVDIVGGKRWKPIASRT